ncbi:MAG: VOC family protein [Phycisphaerae bacterium]
MFLEHVNLTVADLDRSIDFYSRLFGWRLRWKGAASSGRPAAHLGDDRYYLALFETPQNGTASRDMERLGINHFGFVVDDLDDLKSRLAQLGIDPHHQDDYDPGRRLYFLDPDGIEVELVEYEPATA